jgi:hypothetical protein
MTQPRALVLLDDMSSRVELLTPAGPSPHRARLMARLAGLAMEGLACNSVHQVYRHCNTTLTPL